MLFQSLQKISDSPYGIQEVSEMNHVMWLIFYISVALLYRVSKPTIVVRSLTFQIAFAFLVLLYFEVTKHLKQGVYW